MMNKLNYFGVLIESDNKKLNLAWNDANTLEIFVKSEMSVGDIIDYSNHPSVDLLLRDFNTARFLIIRRELPVLDLTSNPDENSNNFDLIITPVILTEKPKERLLDDSEKRMLSTAMENHLEVSRKSMTDKVFANEATAANTLLKKLDKL